MNCPHCQKELPDNYRARWCTFCGKDLPALGTYLVEQPTSANLPPVKTNWLFFFTVLLAPAIFTFSGVALNSSAIVLIATLGGSLVAGKMCSKLLNDKWGLSVAANWLLAGVLAVLSFFLCFGGCVAGSVMGRH